MLRRPVCAALPTYALRFRPCPRLRRTAPPLAEGSSPEAALPLTRASSSGPGRRCGAADPLPAVVPASRSQAQSFPDKNPVSPHSLAAPSGLLHHEGVSHVQTRPYAHTRRAVCTPAQCAQVRARTGCAHGSPGAVRKCCGPGAPPRASSSRGRRGAGQTRGRADAGQFVWTAGSWVCSVSSPWRAARSTWALRLIAPSVLLGPLRAGPLFLIDSTGEGGGAEGMASSGGCRAAGGSLPSGLG